MKMQVLLNKVENSNFTGAKFWKFQDLALSIDSK